MMTDEEKFKFFQKWKGEEVELSSDEEFEHPRKSTLLEIVFYSNIGSLFLDSANNSFRYARPIQKKERLMTIEELDGKWMAHDDKLNKIRHIDKFGVFYVGRSSFRSVEDLYSQGGMWNDKPSFDGLKSLMSEVSE